MVVWLKRNFFRLPIGVYISYNKYALLFLPSEGAEKVACKTPNTINNKITFVILINV